MSQQTTQLIDAGFITKKGEVAKVKDIITTEECWQTKEGKWVLSHKAMQKLANVAGISKSYKVEESTVQPDYKNGLEHIVRITIKCNALKEGSKTSCVHDDENTLTVTGEANRESVGKRGAGYLRKMAEKRGYDIAVLEHLDLYSAIFSEDESESFSKTPTEREETVILMNTDLEIVKNEVNAILKSKDDAELSAAWKLVTDKHAETQFSRNQLTFLANLHEKQALLIASSKK